jgi:hypothetical protein
VPTGANQFCVPGVSELKQEQVQDNNNEINPLISYFQMSINGNSTHSYGSIGITIPAVAESECLKEKVENDEWTTRHSYSNADNWSHVVNPGAYRGHTTGISVVEDCDSLYENTTHQSCSPPSFHSQFVAPAIKWPSRKSNCFQFGDDCRDPLNLGYDVSTGVPKYNEIYSRQKSYRLPQIHGGDCLIVPYQETNANPVSTISKGSISGQFEIECNSEAGHVTLSMNDDMYSLN